MTVQELTSAQLTELKQNYLTMHMEEVEGRTPSWSELLQVNEIFSNEYMYEQYEGTCFTNDDFSCSTGNTSGDDVIDDLVNDLEIECGYYINPAIFAI